MKKISLFLVAATFAVAASAQTPATPAAPAAGAATTAEPKAKPLSLSDKKFIKDASEAILIEQKYLALVVDNKTATFTEETKRATGPMSGELKRIWTALATLATNKGAEVAQEVDKADLAKVQKLSKEKPDKFEKEFFKDLAKETKKTAKLFEGSKSLQDPDVKKFAEDWATVIKGHDVAAETGEKQGAKKK
jgi:hypothetical protein